MAQLNENYKACRDNYLRTLIQNVLHKGGKRILTSYLSEINKIQNLGIETGHPESLKTQICEKTIKNSKLSCSRCGTIGHFYGQQGCGKFKDHICRRCNTKGHWEVKCNNCTRCGFYGHQPTNCWKTTHRNGSEIR
jgi:hypothetical protein